MSRNDIVLLAWGSRSTSNVRLPRSASAAARLMAVVVLPTPPFWLAIATIIWGNETSGGRYSSRERAATDLHLVLAEVVGIETLEPLLQPIGIGLLGGKVDRLRVVDHRVLDENRAADAQRQRDCIARSGIHGDRLAVEQQVN